MARIKQGIYGGFLGKVGKVVGYTLNGQDVMRIIGERRTKPTPDELRNRAKFTASQVWLQPIIDFLRIGFQDYRPTFQGFVAAKSYNSKHALKSDDAGFYIDPSLALVSFGTLDMPANASAHVSAPHQIIVTWQKAGNFAYNDMAMVLAYNVETGRAEFNTAIAKQQQGTATLEIQPHLSGKFHVYLAFVTDDRKNWSNSRYLGEVTIIN